MTCIVGIEHEGQVTLGGDRQFTSEWRVTLSATPKVFERGDVVFGVAGNCRGYQIVEHLLEVPKILADDDPDRWLVKEFVGALRQCFRDEAFAKNDLGRESVNLDLLIGVRGRLYKMDENFGYVRPARGYQAIGGGVDLALGSLHTTGALGGRSPRERLTLALKAAADINMGVSPPFDFVETPA